MVTPGHPTSMNGIPPMTPKNHGYSTLKRTKVLHLEDREATR